MFLILLTEVILAMTYGCSWTFVSAVMNHSLQDFQGCWGEADPGKGKHLCTSMGWHDYDQNQPHEQEKVPLELSPTTYLTRPVSKSPHWSQSLIDCDLPELI